MLGKRKFALKRLEAAAWSSRSIGFCSVCGNEQEGCEPDACDYECEKCGEMAVYGAEELFMLGAVK